eukprot:53949-Eustigmatos_ZCMA.PRE.1
MRDRAYMQLWWSSRSTPFQHFTASPVFHHVHATWQIIPKVNLFRQYEISGSPVRVRINSASTDAASLYCGGQGLVK